MLNIVSAFNYYSNLLLITTISSMSVNPCCLFISAPYAKWRYFVSEKGRNERQKGNGKEASENLFSVAGKNSGSASGAEIPPLGGEGECVI
jgi:hypothetical protein